MTTELVKKRRYQEAWEHILSKPGKTVKIKVTSNAFAARVRKAVWKEKDLDTTLDTDGKTLVKDKYRLTCEVTHVPNEAGATLLFKLVPRNSILNI